MAAAALLHGALLAAANQFQVDRAQFMSSIYIQETAMYAEDPSVPRVRPTEMLLEETCLMATTSVTEAMHRASLGRKSFALLDLGTLEAAKVNVAHHEAASNTTRISRPGQEFSIPWIDGQEGGHFSKGQSSRHKQREVASGMQHVFLLHVHDDARTGQVIISRMDSELNFVLD